MNWELNDRRYGGFRTECDLGCNVYEDYIRDESQGPDVYYKERFNYCFCAKINVRDSRELKQYYKINVRVQEDSNCCGCIFGRFAKIEEMQKFQVRDTDGQIDKYIMKAIGQNAAAPVQKEDDVVVINSKTP